MLTTVRVGRIIKKIYISFETVKWIRMRLDWVKFEVIVTIRNWLSLSWVSFFVVHAEAAREREKIGERKRQFVSI